MVLYSRFPARVQTFVHTMQGADTRFSREEAIQKSPRDLPNWSMETAMQAEEKSMEHRLSIQAKVDAGRLKERVKAAAAVVQQ